MHAILRGCGRLVASLLLAACSYQPTIQHPKLPELAPIETTMQCPQIDLAIDRADTVRWAIRDDGGNLETTGEKAARYAGNVVVVPLSVLGLFPTYIGDGGDAVLHAADRRIEELLQLKREHGCPQRATALAGMDDLALLIELEAITAALDSGSGGQPELFEQRTRLLDGLRVVPAAGGTSP